MTQTRRMQVLRAVVEDYIHTQEPVGSATLLERHDFAVSSATIRKDMGILEQEGYLVQPHTSAGRVPTELAYRYFVDQLAGQASLREPADTTLHALLDGAANLQDALQRAARAVSRYTGQVAVVAAPALSMSRLRHLELIAASSHTVLAVAVTDTGRVAQHILAMDHVPDAAALDGFCRTVNRQCNGMALNDAAAHLRAMQAGDGEESMLAPMLADAFDDMADAEYAHELFMSGVSSLARQHASAAELAGLFDALEEHAMLMRLMSTVSRTPSTVGVGVAIGSETRTPGLLHASVISSGYGIDPHAGGARPVEPVAFVGSIGPTHMNYEVAMAAVHAVARYLTSFLSHDTDGQ